MRDCKKLIWTLMVIAWFIGGVYLLVGGTILSPRWLGFTLLFGSIYMLCLKYDLKFNDKRFPQEKYERLKELQSDCSRQLKETKELMDDILKPQDETLVWYGNLAKDKSCTQ